MGILYSWVANDRPVVLDSVRSYRVPATMRNMYGEKGWSCFNPLAGNPRSWSWTSIEKHDRL